MHKLLILILALFLAMGCKKNEPRTSLLGGWNVSEINESLGQRVYQSNIVRDPVNPELYIIYNFHDLGDNPNIQVRFTDEGDGNLLIESQYIEGANATVVGTGTVMADFSNIEWKYIFNAGIEQITIANYY